MMVAIIGAGAAGMMAALIAKEQNPNLEVFLIEKNKILGRKVLISGGGRCNVTTGIQNIPTVMENYPRGKKFLYSAMHNFSPVEVFNWFESKGVPLKIEEDLRVFPKSNNGEDVVNVFKDGFKKLGVQVWTESEVKDIQRVDHKFRLRLKSGVHEFDRVLLATGGQAYRHTGSTGDGYAFAESLNHTITDLNPSLNSFISSDNWVKSLAGVSLQDVKFKIDYGKIQFRGPFIFTHQGISGPAVFALSSLAAEIKINPQNPLKIKIDFLPNQKFEEIREMMTKVFNENQKKIIKNIMGIFLPKSLELALIENLKINTKKPAAEISKKEINKIAMAFKEQEVNVFARGAGDEFVTAGGIKLNEVNSKTMESKICPGLFFAGEILNIDGFTGGFNLQAAWATGKLAGENLTR